MFIDGEYAEGVTFLSPGSRSAPWEGHPAIAYAVGVIQGWAAHALRFLVSVCAPVFVQRLWRKFVLTYTQGALRDPGLRNVTPSAYPISTHYRDM